ncbi:SAM domain-containing protein SAMSN-1 isoform X2 [Rana temporaria]|uniref:SAM domain-containing protein SAMSN-1 isoform X2 n=1 Tax=Rana temporaria TaxID=8407 RepID=UPI001AADCCF9|nr:SAM domain-containing protein SAMSN-1 isoform X2 [Rana temporaria]
MNLFCFSLEGSMDNLYEPVQNIQETSENFISRACSPPCTFVKPETHERSFSMELSDLETTDAKKKIKKSLIQKSVSENEAFDRRVWNTAYWQNSRSPDNESYLRRHCHIEDLSEEEYIMGDRTNSLTRLKEENISQIPSYEPWNPAHNQCSNSNGCTNEMELDDNKSESMGTLKRLQKMVRTKKTNDDVRHALLQSPTQDIEEEEEETLVTCMKLGKSQEKKTTKDIARKRQEAERSVEVNCASLDRSGNLKRNISRGMVTCQDNPTQFMTNWKTFPNSFDPFSASQMEGWEHCACCNHYSQLPPSFTDMALPYAWRTSSFGTFDRFKKPSISKAEDLNEVGDSDSIFEGGGPPDGDKASNHGGSLTKKMKAISLTMRKKMGKKYIKALSESEDGDGAFAVRDSDPTGGHAADKCTLQASESVESLYSLNSGQSSSSGVTSCSDGTSNRDSFRLDDDVPYTGPFCGRARVHTDSTPSPYDTDSLKIKKGDIIDIIYKTPMGIWTGMLNNKIGNFKFIYVDIISEEETPVPRKIVRRKSKRPRPKTLQELLERFNLQEYMSSLLLNGYESLEDLKDINESQLCELNITNPEERMRFLVAIDNLQDPDGGQEPDKEAAPLTLSPDISKNKSELDCPRDSGCYITLDNSENNKEDTDSEKLCEGVQKITITECP